MIPYQHLLDMTRKLHGLYGIHSQNLLAYAPSTEISEESMCVIERFVILICDQTSTCTDINQARKKLFAKTSSVKKIPPIPVSCLPRWGQALTPNPGLVSPSSWGWTKTDGGLYEPHWTTLQAVSTTCYELICCGCKKGCQINCKCRKADLQYTALCKPNVKKDFQ